jgi:hypothetical protein
MEFHFKEFWNLISLIKDRTKEISQILQTVKEQRKRKTD